MKVRIEPGKAGGTFTAPPSKSLSHRYLLSSALSGDASRVKNLLWSEDIMAMAGCLQAMGAEIEVKEDEAVFLNRLTDIRRDNGEENKNPPVLLDVHESGSALRFLIPLCLGLNIHALFSGSERLFDRPLNVYEDLAEKEGFLFEKGRTSLRVFGELDPGRFQFDAGTSSQFVTGLLFCLPLLNGDSEIELSGHIGSRSYIDMTLGVLHQYGITASWKDERTLSVPGNQKYLPREVVVEGDYSNTAIFEAFNAVGGDVKISGLSENSLQGDRIYREYISELKKGFASIDISDSPDLGPVLFSLAAALHGGRFTGTERLKIKESNRTEAMRQELSKFGIACSEEENVFTVFPGSINPPEECLDSHHDHRVVMALSLLLSLTGGEIKGAEAINKSFPGFFRILGELGLSVTRSE